MFKHGGVNGLVDLTGQDLLSTGNGKSSHFVTKRFTSTLHLLSSFSTSILDDAVGFDLSLSFGFIDDTLSTLFTVRNNGGGTGAGVGFDGLALLGRDSQSLLTLVSGRETIGDLLLTLFNRVDQRRPDVLHGDPGTKEEHDHL